jgi:hypothetical protein
VEFQLGVLEPVAELVDLRPIAIVQMLSRAEDLNGWHTGLPNLLQPKRR